MEWTNKTPDKNALYWHKDELKNVTIVKIWGIEDTPMVAHIGTDWDSYLKDTKGKWQGPILPPK